MKTGNKNKAAAYATYDRRKAQAMAGEGPQYDEIPYGDVGPPGLGMPPQQQQQQMQQQQAAAAAAAGTSGKGQLPEVPSEYAQLPTVPARQGL